MIIIYLNDNWKGILQLMETINFDMNSGQDGHKCKSYRDGDWIVFYCPQCHGYERRINWRTGEKKSKNIVSDIRHSGLYFPLEYKQIYEDVN